MPDESPSPIEDALRELKVSRTWSAYAPLDSGQMLRLQARFGRAFHPALKRFYAIAGGGEFSLGGGLVVFFDAEAVLDAHKRLKETLPGWIAFADDARGTWFMLRAMDPEGAVFSVDSRSPSLEGAWQVATDFPGFLCALTRGTLEL